jgi:hypothetical protein
LEVGLFSIPTTRFAGLTSGEVSSTFRVKKTGTKIRHVSSLIYLTYLEQIPYADSHS